jgi:hypothetical protein
MNTTKRHQLITEVPKYDTGWTQASSGFQNKEFTATHNLGLALDKLDIDFLISTDGTDANSFKILDTDSSTTLDSTGIEIYYVSDNAIKVQTGTYGLLYILDSGTSFRLDTESYYYRIIVRAKDQFITQKPTWWNYSTSEVATGETWIDGKPIYRKIIDCGALPNATTKKRCSWDNNNRHFSFCLWNC